MVFLHSVLNGPQLMCCSGETTELDPVRLGLEKKHHCAYNVGYFVYLFNVVWVG